MQWEHTVFTTDHKGSPSVGTWSKGRTQSTWDCWGRCQGPISYLSSWIREESIESSLNRQDRIWKVTGVWMLRCIWGTVKNLVLLEQRLSSVQSLSRVWLFETPWTAARQEVHHQLPPTCSNSSPLSQWCHPTISSSVIPFSSCPWSFPASESFPMSQFFASSGQRIGVSTSASVLSIIFRTDFLQDGLVWSPCSPRDS